MAATIGVAVLERDPYGNLHRAVQFRAGEPTHDEKSRSVEDIRGTANTPLYSKADVVAFEKNPVKDLSVVTSPDGQKKRRQLPQTPKPKQLHDKLYHASPSIIGKDSDDATPISVTKSSFVAPSLAAAEMEEPLDEEKITERVVKKILTPLPPAIVCKYFCTATGPNTRLRCINCQVEYCGACLIGKKGPMYYVDSRRGHGMTPVTKIRCAECKHNPKVPLNGIKPDWQGPPLYVFGQPLALVIDKKDREHQQHNALGKDKYLLQSLRNSEYSPARIGKLDEVEEDFRKIRLTALQKGTSLSQEQIDEYEAEKAKAYEFSKSPKHYVPEQEQLPNVFERLCDVRLYNSTHKHRFYRSGSDIGKGRGLDGQRDDDQLNQVIAGNGKILRDMVHTEDSPNRPLLERERSITSPPRSRPSSTPPVDDLDGTVYGRLAAPSPQHMLRQKGMFKGEYEQSEDIRKQFGVNKESIPHWQSGLY